MTLTLRAVSLNDDPLTQPITARFDEHGGTIGRADHNTMALPDPERHISREQAEITATPTGYMIRNVGSSNPIVVRDQSLVHGEAVPLGHGDKVRIGRYLLEVAEDAQPQRDADAMRTLPSGETSAPERRSRGPVAAAGEAAPLSPGNPFADLLGPPVTPSRAAPRAAAQAAVASPWPARLPEDFDPFAPPAPAPPAARPAPAGAFEDLVPSSASRSIDELFGLDGPAAGDALAGFLADVKAPAQAGPTASTDPLVLFGAAAPVTPPPEVIPDRTPEMHAAFTPPRPVAKQPAPVAEPVREPWPAGAAVAATAATAGTAATATTAANPIAPATAASPATPVPPAARADSAALWSAFCEAAGVKVDLPQGLQPEMMRVLGTLLRAAIDGTLQLMAVRSATRHELHAQVTMIQARNNNPLKFSPDGQAALEQLLQPPLRGFLPGPAAVTEAMDDLVGHAIGTMAGTRSALEGVLARFAPQPLEEKLAANAVIDSVLPMARKAKLWDLYLQHHESIREEAQEDFHALFGKAFLAAYEQQLEQLRRERQRARA